MSNNNKKPVIRSLDIETFPNVAHVWGIWQQNVGMNQIMQSDQIASFAYKDLGKDFTYYADLRLGSEKVLTKLLRDTLDKTDILIGHNFKRFDDKWIIGRCLKYGLKPPSPYRIVDTLLEARKVIKMPSYRLDAVAKFFKVAEKSSHAKFAGHSLWTECMKDNEDAWEEMEAYNRQDVITTEEVYLKLRPYMKTHPNLAIFHKGEDVVCGRCQSTDVHRRGYVYTNGGKYPRIRCNNCGGWGRLRKSVLGRKRNQTNPTNV